MFARSPIFCTDQRVFGHEIWLRADPALAEPSAEEELLDWARTYPFVEGAGSRLLLTVTSTQLDALLDAPELEPLRSRRAVLALNEGWPDLGSALRCLHERGYGILLDETNARREPALLPLTEIVCANPRGASEHSLAELAAGGRQVLARGLATPAQQRAAAGRGFTLFQGDYYAVPAARPPAELPRSKAGYLLFLAELGKPALDFERIEAILKREPALVLRLMRYMNSPLFGARSPIASVRQALVHLGEEPLRRWGRVLAVTSLSEDRPSELAMTALVRARVCERIGQRESPAKSEAYFLTGLLSLVDAMLGVPAVQCLFELPIDGTIRRAILGEDNPLGRALKTARAFERGEWQRLDALAGAGVDPGEVHTEALSWSAQILSAGAA